MALPVAGIVCIVLACWVVLVLALFALYRFLKHRGTCECECNPCGTAGGESCSCCKAISDSCDCCNPSLNGCLNSVCPKKKLSCVDIILCQCCAEPGQDSCLVNTLQYIFWCPLKCFAVHCMIGDRETALPIWQYEGLSFCEWVGSKIRPKVCDSMKCVDVSCLKCSKPVEEDTNCCSAVCSCCSGTENKQPFNCKCLECHCTQHFAALCSKFNVWTCLKCAKDDNSSLNVCEKCNCFTSSSSEPLTCPTYEMKVSSSFRNIAQCPGCPDHVLCCSCSEYQGVNCCCHYIFCNRCGDPVFEYDYTKDICTFRESNCCSFLFQSLLIIPRFLFLGCYGLCVNSVRCCYFSCLNCAYLVSCKCSDEAFCINYSCLCFDCKKIQNTQETNSDDDIKGCKCACCIYMPAKAPSFLSADIEISKPCESFEADSNDELNDALQGTVKSSDGNVYAVKETFQIVDEKKVRSNKSLGGKKPAGKKTKKSMRPRRQHVNKVTVGEYRSKSENLILESASSDDDIVGEYTNRENIDIESDTSDFEEELRRLQGELLNDFDETDSKATDKENAGGRTYRKPSKYADDQYDGNSESKKQANAIQNNIHIKGREDRNKATKPGILKNHSMFSTDAEIDIKKTETFSIYNECRSGKSSRTKKRAHFANEDQELVKELFTKKLPERGKNETIGKNRKRKVKGKMMSEKANSDTSRKIYTSSDESDITANLSTRKKTSSSGKRKVRASMKSPYDNSDDDGEMSKAFFKTYREVHPNTHSSGIRIDRSRKRNKMDAERKNVFPENSEQKDEVKLIDYNSSEEEFAVESKRLAKDEMILEDLDNLPTGAVVDNEMNKKNKSISQRLKEIKLRRSQSELGNDSDTWM